jgi:hypothetical protein
MALGCQQYWSSPQNPAWETPVVITAKAPTIKSRASCPLSRIEYLSFSSSFAVRLPRSTWLAKIRREMASWQSDFWDAGGRCLLDVEPEVV